jgi:hypothetical protein
MSNVRDWLCLSPPELTDRTFAFTSSISSQLHRQWFTTLACTLTVSVDFAVWTTHFLMMSKRLTNSSLIQCIGA